jgi:hypothetical protein
MLFKYFQDKIILNNKLINEDVSFPLLDEFIRKTKDYLIEMGIKNQDVSFFYKRNKTGASVIGIQIEDGDNEDISNYVVYDALAHKDGVSMDFHAKSKIIEKALSFNTALSKEVYIFLCETEKKIIETAEPDIEFDIMKKVHVQKKSKFLQIFKIN